MNMLHSYCRHDIFRCKKSNRLQRHDQMTLQKGRPLQVIAACTSDMKWIAPFEGEDDRVAEAADDEICGGCKERKLGDGKKDESEIDKASRATAGETTTGRCRWPQLFKSMHN